MPKEQRLAEVVRTACIEAALAAYEEGGVLGLCAEGRWEYAVSVMRELDVGALIAGCLNEQAVHKSSSGNPADFVAD